MFVGVYRCNNLRLFAQRRRHLQSASAVGCSLGCPVVGASVASISFTGPVFQSIMVGGTLESVFPVFITVILRSLT